MKTFKRPSEKFGLEFRDWCLAVKGILSSYAVNESKVELSQVRTERSKRKRQHFRLEGADLS